MLAVIETNELADLLRGIVREELKAKETPLPSVMSKAQLAEYWNCSTATINRYMNAGMPFGKVDKGHPRFYLAECEKWKRERI